MALAHRGVLVSGGYSTRDGIIWNNYLAEYKSASTLVIIRILRKGEKAASRQVSWYGQMSVIRTKVGNTEVLIETVGTKSQGLFPGMEDTANSDTIGGKVLNAFESAKEVISGIVQEFSAAVACEVNPPTETKIGFSMSLSTEGNIWLIKSGSNMTLNVELTWKQRESDE